MRILARIVLLAALLAASGCGTQLSERPPTGSKLSVVHDGANPIEIPRDRFEGLEPLREDCPPAVAELFLLLESPLQRPRLVAIKKLASHAQADAKVADVVVAELGGLLEHPDCWTRAAAIKELGEIGGSTSIEQPSLLADHHGVMLAMVAALEDPVEGVREAASEELAKIAGSDFEVAKVITYHLIPLLDSSRPGASIAAAESVGGIASQLARRQRLLDESGASMAKVRFAEAGDFLWPAIQPLRQLAAKPDERTRRIAARALEAVERFGGQPQEMAGRLLGQRFKQK